MTRAEARRLNQEAREWANRDPEKAFRTYMAAIGMGRERYGDEVYSVADKYWPQRRDNCLAFLLNAGNKPTGLNGLSVLAVIFQGLRRPEVRPERQLPRFGRVDDNEALRVPGFEVGRPPVQDAILPGFQGIASSVPSWLLSVYDQAGGITEARGRGAPWGLRLFVGALLTLPVEFRDGRQQLIPLTTGDLARWLLPGGWDRRPSAFDRLQRALRDLDRLRVPIGIDGTSGGLLKVVDCPLLPAAYDRGRGPVVLRVSIPGGAARGAHVEWDRLTRYGANSAPLYRAYLSVCAVLDYSARAGRALTQTIPAPVLDAYGRARRSKSGRRIIRSKVLTMPNPAARYVSWLSPDDVRHMVGLAADHKMNRKRAREALEQLEEDGVVIIERQRGGLIRLFGPGPPPP